MLFIKIILPTSFFINVLICFNIALNITHVSFESKSINRTSPSKNETIVTKTINLTGTNNVAPEENTKGVESKKVEMISMCKKTVDCKNPNTQCENSTCILKCNDTNDCDDPRMTCKNKLCLCSRFHSRIPQSIECAPNVTRIMLWLKKSSSLESNIESQGSAFEIKQEEPYTILAPIWAEYQGAKEVGLGFIPTPVWPVVICIGLLLLVYSLILYDIV